jgi:hypothetical protein
VRAALAFAGELGMFFRIADPVAVRVIGGRAQISTAPTTRRQGIAARQLASEADWSPEIASKCAGLFSAASPICLEYRRGQPEQGLRLRVQLASGPLYGFRSASQTS